MKEIRDILILDDDPNIVKILSDLMELKGITCATAGSIGDATRRLSEYQFLAILSDMQMPLATGTQFLEMIRNHNIQTPVVILSGVSEPERVIEAMGFGAFDYIFKPYKQDELLAVLKKAMDAGRKLIEEASRAAS